MSEQETFTYQPRYVVTKFTFTIISILGVASIVLSIFWAINTANSLTEKYYGFDWIEIASALWGIIAGIFTIAAGQLGLATVDNMNANQEILALMKQRAMRE